MSGTTTSLARRLRTVQAELGLTVDELAELCRLPQDAMREVLSGGRVDDDLLEHGTTLPPRQAGHDLV